MRSKLLQTWAFITIPEEDLSSFQRLPWLDFTLPKIPGVQIEIHSFAFYSIKIQLIDEKSPLLLVADRNPVSWSFFFAIFDIWKSNLIREIIYSKINLESLDLARLKLFIITNSQFPLPNPKTNFLHYKFSTHHKEFITLIQIRTKNVTYCRYFLACTSPFCYQRVPWLDAEHSSIVERHRYYKQTWCQTHFQPR